MRVVLSNPPRTKLRQADVVSYPNLGILSIVAYARQFMPDVEFIYLESLHIDEYASEIEKLGPDIFCLSFATCMHVESFAAMQRIHEVMPSLPIICGGPHPTAMPDEVLEKSPAIAVAMGEGEETFLELLRYFKEPKDKLLSKIGGIAYRDEKGIVQKNPLRPFLDLDTLPMIAWDLIDLNAYKGAHISKMKYSTCILPSRGCPFNCVFCSNPVWKSQKPWLRLRDPQKVADEVLWLYKKGIREIYIRSDELNAQKAWTLELCKKIANLNLKDLKFQCNLRADHVDQEIAQAFQSIGLWLVYLGIESYNQRVIDGIQKCIDIKSIPTACAIMKKHGIKVYGFVMLYQAWEEHGILECETTAEVDNTLINLWRLIRKGYISYLSWQFATPFPGSQLWDVAHKYGLIENSSAGVWDISMRLPKVKQRDMIRQRMFGFMLQAYCGIRSGNLNWSMWKRYLNKIFYIVESAFYVLFTKK
jgi:anaerobic magnesium-protoporphyrin IX monomethyl ester cyclase